MGAAETNVDCPACGPVAALPVPAGGRVACPRCGREAVAGGAPPPLRREVACPHCAERVEEGAPRCRHCGERLDAPPGPRPARRPAPIALRVLGVLIMGMPLFSCVAPVASPLIRIESPVGGVVSLVLALRSRVGWKGAVFLGLVLTILNLYFGWGLVRGERSAVRWLAVIAAALVAACLFLVSSLHRAEHLLMVALFYGPACVAGVLAWRELE